MALQEIEIDTSSFRGQPEDVEAFLSEANRRIDALYASGENRRTPKFIPSDPDALFKVFDFIVREGLSLGPVFCEWGSGYGVATCLAALLGHEAYGIEIEGALVSAARELAADMGIDAVYCESSYLPEGLESYEGMGGEELVVAGGREDAAEFAYEGMGRDLSEVDVFYVYPWPGEQEFMERLFDAVAVEGALLVVYYGEGETRLYRKVFSGGDDF